MRFTSHPSLICSQSAVSWSRPKNMWSLTSTLSPRLHAVVEILHDLGIGAARLCKHPIHPLQSFPLLLLNCISLWGNWFRDLINYFFFIDPDDEIQSRMSTIFSK